MYFCSNFLVIIIFYQHFFFNVFFWCMDQHYLIMFLSREFMSWSNQIISVSRKIFITHFDLLLNVLLFIRVIFFVSNKVFFKQLYFDIYELKFFLIFLVIHHKLCIILKFDSSFFVKFDLHYRLFFHQFIQFLISYSIFHQFSNIIKSQSFWFKSFRFFRSHRHLLLYENNFSKLNSGYFSKKYQKNSTYVYSLLSQVFIRGHSFISH